MAHTTQPSLKYLPFGIVDFFISLGLAIMLAVIVMHFIARFVPPTVEAVEPPCPQLILTSQNGI